MSILIKGMKMPKSCSDCFMHSCSVFTDHDTCMALKKDIWKLGVLVERLEDCPLVEVPTPHGRLIDADDAFIDADERGCDFWSCDADIDSAHEFLMAQPTIIEAEEGDPDVNTD